MEALLKSRYKYVCNDLKHSRTSVFNDVMSKKSGPILLLKCSFSDPLAVWFLQMQGADFLMCKLSYSF